MLTIVWSSLSYTCPIGQRKPTSVEISFNCIHWCFWVLTFFFLKSGIYGAKGKPSCECRGLNHSVFFASWAIARILYTHTQHVYPETDVLPTSCNICLWKCYQHRLVCAVTHEVKVMGEDVAPIERLFRSEAQFSRLTWPLSVTCGSDVILVTFSRSPQDYRKCWVGALS